MVYLDLFGGSGGVGRVSRELIPALAQAGGEPVTVAGPSHAVHSLCAALASRSTGVQFVNLTPPRFSPRRALYEFAFRTDAICGGAFPFLWGDVRRQLGECTTPPLVNYPQVLHPPSCDGRFATLIHDLNWRSFPENFANPKRLDGWCRGWIERSTVTFTNSEFTRCEIIDAYPIAPQKVVAAPLAPFNGDGQASFDESVLTRHGLTPGEFHLFPGVHGAHKGHDLLCTALEQAGATRPVVVTCGSNIPSPTAARKAQAAVLREAMAAQQRAGRLIVLYNLSDPEMNSLRRDCRAYVLPSRYEGYGFPLAEAFAWGKPAIHSSIPAFLEITARHAGLRSHTFPSGDAAGLAALLEADATDAIDWQSGAASVEDWTWSDTARTILFALGLPTRAVA
jgi:glycosyltransferase involved in cell wall biosynthesis